MKAEILANGVMRITAELPIEAYALKAWSESEKQIEYDLELIDLGRLNKEISDFYKQNKKEFIEWRQAKKKETQ